VLVNIARYLAIDPESALRKTNRKFRRRFQWMEERLGNNAGTLESASMNELESLWQQAKRPGEAIVSADAIAIRRCEGLDELRACVALQKESGILPMPNWFRCECSWWRKKLVDK